MQRDFHSLSVKDQLYRLAEVAKLPYRRSSRERRACVALIFRLATPHTPHPIGTHCSFLSPTTSPFLCHRSIQLLIAVYLCPSLVLILHLALSLFRCAASRPLPFSSSASSLPSYRLLALHLPYPFLPPPHLSAPLPPPIPPPPFHLPPAPLHSTCSQPSRPLVRSNGPPRRPPTARRVRLPHRRPRGPRGARPQPMGRVPMAVHRADGRPPHRVVRWGKAARRLPLPLPPALP